MEMTISLPDDVAIKLRERAASTGESVPVYSAKLLAESVTKPTIDELLAPVRADFAKTGMNGDELLQFGRDVLAAVRSERHDYLWLPKTW
jgi:plasmid stability protein